jgi:BASS family bile acid:Na+ symporter
METLTLLFNLSVVLFVVATMLSMGLGLKISQIIEPLKRPLLVGVVLVTNFVLIPLAVLLLVSLLPIDEGTKIGLIILSLSAGAPFTPKLAEIAKGDTALATAVMLLLMVATVLILPIALPMMLEGDLSIESSKIAKSLIVMMIIPLAIGLGIRAKFEVFATRWQGRMVKLSNIALLAIIIFMSILNGKDIIAIIGYDLIAVILFMLIALLIGYLLGGKLQHNRVISSLAAGQRNISAALVVAAQNFDDPKVTIIIIAVSIVGLFILLFSAKKFSHLEKPL